MNYPAPVRSLGNVYEQKSNECIEMTVDLSAACAKEGDVDLRKEVITT
jgi:hypothetical protein